MNKCVSKQIPLAVATLIIMLFFSRPMQLQASGPQADFAPSAGGLRGPVLPDILEETELDLPGSRADLLQGQALAGPAQTYGPRLQVGAHQGAAGEIKW